MKLTKRHDLRSIKQSFFKCLEQNEENDFLFANLSEGLPESALMLRIRYIFRPEGARIDTNAPEILNDVLQRKTSLFF